MCLCAWRTGHSLHPFVKMNELLPLTELLYSCWIISGGTSEAKQSLPTSRGLLDVALKTAIDKGAFPDWARKQLHFVNGRMGLVCPELPVIQRLATSLKITSEPNPSYVKTDVVVGETVALRSLAFLGISEEDAKGWGKCLRDAVEKSKAAITVEEPV